MSATVIQVNQTIINDINLHWKTDNYSRSVCTTDDAFDKHVPDDVQISNVTCTDGSVAGEMRKLNYSMHFRWRRHEFSFGGCSLRPWGWKSLTGVQGKTLVWGLRTKSPKAETVCRHCLQILTAKTIKIWKFPHQKVDPKTV